jgi:hypothetical protein
VAQFSNEETITRDEKANAANEDARTRFVPRAAKQGRCGAHA